MHLKSDGESIVLGAYPLVSVIVPTKNRPGLLSACLVSLCYQDYPKHQYEIVVVDDGSTDEKVEKAVRKFCGGEPRVHYVFQPPRGLNAARNRGVVEAQGDPVVFVDDDVEAPSGWLTALVAGSQQYPNAVALGGPVYMRVDGNGSLPRTCRECGTVETAEAFTYGPQDRDVDWVIGANMAIRRNALHRIGAFNEIFTYGGGDEVEWQIRAKQAGMSVVYVAGAWLWHKRTPEDMRIGLLKKSFLRNKWHIQLLLQTGGKLPSPKRALVATISDLRHALRKRCFMGMFRAAANLGFMAGYLRWGVIGNRV